jgi:hypothetical protein
MLTTHLKFIVLTLAFLIFTTNANAQDISPAPSAAVFVTGAYVTWTTTSAGTSSVDYGATVSYGTNIAADSNITNTNGTVFHVVAITGLSANTTYHYKVTTGTTSSSDFTFTTLAYPTGTVKTVKSSGGDYTSLDTCMDAASAGWTCLVWNGATVGEITPSKSGSGGTYITATAYDDVSSSGFTLNGADYIAINGFKFTGSVSTSSTSAYVTIDNNYFENISGNVIDAEDLSSCSYWEITNNVVHTGGYKGILLPGTYHLISDNDFSNLPNDFIYNGYMQYSVVRNNTVHDFDCGSNCSESNYHMDFFQWDGYGSLPLRYTLIEGNTMLRWDDPQGNIHALISRGDESSPQNLIFRYNTVMDLTDGSGMTLGTAEDNLSQRIYNNTFATGNKTEDGVFSSYYASYTKSLNNLAYDTCGTTENCFDTGTGVVNNYNVQRDSVNASAAWGDDYQDEATYSTLKNLSPSFTNYPYEATISSSSVLIDKGGHLTTVTSGCGTSTLVLADVRWFQSGWATVSPDILKIGSSVADSVEATISSISYSSTASTSSGTVVFSSTVGCENGDKVWLYKKSDGNIVLSGDAPDIGAYEYIVDEQGGGGQQTNTGTVMTGVSSVVTTP